MVEIKDNFYNLVLRKLLLFIGGNARVTEFQSFTGISFGQFRKTEK